MAFLTGVPFLRFWSIIRVAVICATPWSIAALGTTAGETGLIFQTHCSRFGANSDLTLFE